MNENMYIVRDVLDKGRGMFATQDIKRGTCVISESPLVFVGSNILKNLQAINALSKKNKKSFFALSNIYTDDELPQEIGIIKTNALPLGKESNEAAAVYRVISRINHSCAPNVQHSWNSITQMEYIYAIKDITAGSEILTTYVAPLTTREARQKTLKKSFRFTCQCRFCAAASSEEHDATVTRINECSDLIVKFASSNPRKAIQCVREALALLDKIEVGGKATFCYDGFQINAMYSNYKLAKEWADLLLETYRFEEGETGHEYGRYLAYSIDAKAHEYAGRGRYVDLRGV
ncbi:hypothetical protein BGZ96_004191 [Linnemannia gamsii]|uniref:SET domain-containing protein n=1 Tax=Linnemannia gamsii TaxID=64522 RepID=A0ABQ7JIC7_9FUNG|nr:hypothetical protein BGZ96_004191 [Linnemannia gamsii]